MTSSSSAPSGSGGSGGGEDDKSFLRRIAKMLDKINPKKKKKSQKDKSDKSGEESKDGSSHSSHHHRERSHHRERTEDKTQKSEHKTPSDQTVKTAHKPSKKLKRRKSADSIPSRDSEGDVTVFEGIRGRSKPAKTKLRKSKKSRKHKDDSDSDSTKSEFRGKKKKEKDSTKSAYLPPTSSDWPKKKDKEKKPKLPLPESDSEASTSEKDIISLLGNPKTTEQKSDSTMAIVAPTFDPSPTSTMGLIKAPERVSPPPTSPTHTRTDHWMDFETGEVFPDKANLVPAAKSTLDNQSQEQYVAYRYINTQPVVGRAWNEDGKIVASFPYNRNELRTVGVPICLLQRPNANATFTYEWRPFSEVSSFETDKLWHPVRVHHRSPAIITVPEGKILGQVDLRNEAASYSFNGASHEIVGPPVHKTLVLCRKNL